MLNRQFFSKHCGFYIPTHCLSNTPSGPLSDTYGRKPLIVISLAGFFILNLVFMINSIFFMELKVEYILFECLQDLTGGNPIFNLALTSYIADVSSTESRTARLCFVSAVTSFGFMVGGPLGTRIRALFGYVPLFGVNLGLATIAILYSIFVLKDSMELVSEERREEIEMEKFKAEIKCDRCKLSNHIVPKPFLILV